MSAAKESTTPPQLFFRAELRYSAAFMQEATPKDPQRAWTNLAQAAFLVVLEVVSLVFLVESFTLGEDLVLALQKNEFPEGVRERTLLGLALNLGVAASALIVGARKWSSGRVLHYARIAAPLIPLGLLPTLVCTEFWFKRPLDYLVTLGLFALLCEATFRPFFAALGPLVEPRTPERIKPWLRSKWPPLVAVLIASAAYTVVTSHLTIMDHHRFGTGSYDLGIFDNMMFNTLHGAPFKSSIMYGPKLGNSLAGHAEFAMVLFAPLYALYPRAEGLLVLQAIALGSAAIPLYFLAKTRLGSWSSCLIALLYLLYAPVHGAQYYDFHWLPMAIPFLFLLFFGLAVGSKKIVIPTTLLLFALREDIAPGLAVVGIFLMLTGTRPKWGAILTATSCVWFGLVKFAIMPYFGTWFFAELYSDLAIPGEPGYGSVIKTLMTNPLFVIWHLFTQPKFEYALHILVPLAFVPLRRPALLLLLIPGVFFTILTNWPATYSLKFHYSTHFIPYVFTALVLYLAILKKQETSSDRSTRARSLGAAPAALTAVSLTLLCHSTVFGLIIAPDSFIGGIQPVSYTMTEKEKQRLSDLRSLIAMIPRNASVTATDFDVPHLSNRAHIYAIGQRRDAGRYLLLGPDSFRLARTKENIHAIMEAHPYGFVARAGKMTLWKKGHEPKDPKEAMRVKRQLYRQLGVRPTRPPTGRPPRSRSRPHQSPPDQSP